MSRTAGRASTLSTARPICSVTRADELSVAAAGAAAVSTGGAIARSADNRGDKSLEPFGDLDHNRHGCSGRPFERYDALDLVACELLGTALLEGVENMGQRCDGSRRVRVLRHRPGVTLSARQPDRTADCQIFARRQISYLPPPPTGVLLYPKMYPPPIENEVIWYEPLVRQKWESKGQDLLAQTDVVRVGANPRNATVN